MQNNMRVFSFDPIKVRDAHLLPSPVIPRQSQEGIMIRLQFCSAFLIREELLFYQLDCYSWVELNNFQSM
jgi:hypothetical protein